MVNRRSVSVVLVVATQVVLTTVLALHNGHARSSASVMNYWGCCTSPSSCNNHNSHQQQNSYHIYDTAYSLSTTFRRTRATRLFAGKTESGTYSARFLDDNGLELSTEPDGRVVARPRNNGVRKTATATVEGTSPTSTTASEKPKQQHQPESGQTPPKLKLHPPRPRPAVTEQPARPVPQTGFNVVLTHCTADFDSLASAVGLARLWSVEEHKTPGTGTTSSSSNNTKSFDSASHVPTFVVLPRGAHPAVQRFLALHKHLFPIRSLKSLPTDLSGLNRLALVDAQRRDRIGPAEPLLQHAKRITVVDHHIDQDSDIQHVTDYVVDKVGSVTTLICERLQTAGVELSDAEATLLALGVHADTGSLRFDSTTPRDAHALAWCLDQGASQAAIAEHGQSSLSTEQQNVLTQALMSANATVIHGVTLSTVLLSAEGFINGLAAVTQDALELSSSDVFLLGLVYEAQSGGRRGSKKRRFETGRLLTSRLVKTANDAANSDASSRIAWQEGEEAARRRRLQAEFDRKDTNGSGTLNVNKIMTALKSSGVIASPESVQEWMSLVDTDGDGEINFDEFVAFCIAVEQEQQQADIQDNQDGDSRNSNSHHKSTTLIVIGRVKAGVNLKAVKLNKLFEPFGGGGHAKAASATMRLNDPSEATTVLQGLVDDLVASSLQEQPTVGDFMTSPVLSVKPTMTESQVEDLFKRYDVRALPVVDEDNDVIGLVTYKEVAAAKQRLWNKEQKRLRRERQMQQQQDAADADGVRNSTAVSLDDEDKMLSRKQGTTVKGWMKQHVQLVEVSKTMAEVELFLLENDVGCIPVVADGTRQLVGMVTRTDLLRQHRYYPSLPYHNKGFADSIAARKPMIELRRKLKRFDID